MRNALSSSNDLNFMLIHAITTLQFTVVDTSQSVKLNRSTLSHKENKVENMFSQQQVNTSFLTVTQMKDKGLI